MKWEDVKKEYLRERRAMFCEGTVLGDLKSFGKFEKYYISSHGQLPDPSRLGEKEFLGFVEFVNRSKTGEGTLWDASYRHKLMLRIIRFFEFARNPNSFYMRKYLPKVYIKPREYYSDSELRVILTMYDGYGGFVSVRNRTFLNVAYYTGMRNFEVLSLKWSDVDFDQNYITIVKGKGGRTRKAFIHPNLKTVLLVYRSEWENYLDYIKRTYGDGSTDYLFFVYHDGDIRVVPDRMMYNACRRRALEVGIKNFNIKKFRSTFCKIFDEGGASLEEAALMLGHINIETTRRSYRSLNYTRQEKISKRCFRDVVKK
jgi:integrase